MKRKILHIIVLIGLLAGLLLSVQPAFAVSLPANTNIDSATLYIYVNHASGHTVNVHRVTANWSELGVTWANFGGAYDPAVVGSFVADSTGWKSVDVTSLVQDWVDGTYPNFGILIEQGATDYTRYFSSDHTDIALRPGLEICFSGNCEMIRRGIEGTVVDSRISELHPNYNYGTDPVLFTGLINGYEKQSLLRFEFELTPPPSGGEGCTPGFWRQEQHFDSWVGYSPEDSYNTTFVLSASSFDTLLDAVWARGGGENALARHAVAALLNASSPDVDYAYSESQIIQMVQDAYSSGDFEGVKNLFEYENELGCPLD